MSCVNFLTKPSETYYTCCVSFSDRIVCFLSYRKSFQFMFMFVKLIVNCLWLTTDIHWVILQFVQSHIVANVGNFEGFEFLTKIARLWCKFRINEGNSDLDYQRLFGLWMYFCAIWLFKMVFLKRFSLQISQNFRLRRYFFFSKKKKVFCIKFAV